MIQDDPVLIVAVYGAYQRWLGPFLESALATGHRDFIIVTDGGTAEEAEHLATWAFEGSAVQSTAVEESADYREMVNDPGLRRMAYLAAWRRALRLLPTGQRFACVHVDTLIQRPVAACWTKPTVNTEPYGLAAQTQRQGPRWSFDTTLLCGQAAPIILGEMDTLLREAIRFARGPQREVIARLYGSFESAAMAMLLARSMDGGGTIIGQFKAGTVGVDPASTVLHFAGAVPPEHTPIGRRWHTLGAQYTARQGVVATPPAPTGTAEAVTAMHEMLSHPTSPRPAEGA